MLYKLKDKVTGEINHVYGVERRGDETFFLVHTKEYGWSWVHSSHVEPLVIKELEMLK